MLGVFLTDEVAKTCLIPQSSGPLDFNRTVILL